MSCPHLISDTSLHIVKSVEFSHIYSRLIAIGTPIIVRGCNESGHADKANVMNQLIRLPPCLISPINVALAETKTEQLRKNPNAFHAAISR